MSEEFKNKKMQDYIRLYSFELIESKLYILIICLNNYYILFFNVGN